MKPSYKMQKELEEFPQQLEALDKKIASIKAQIAAPDFYQKSRNDMARVTDELAKLQTEQETKFERWSELEAM